MPKILSFHTKFEKSFAENFFLAPGLDILTTQHPSDAHCVGYLPKDKGAKFCPRWSKLDTAGALESLESCWVFLDYDLPREPDAPKRGWQEGEFERFMERLIQWEWAHAAGWYRTNHGARLVRPLQEGIDVLSFESLYLAVLAQAREACGIEFDPACKDWTRLFRLPFVRRGGVDILPTPDSDDFSNMRPFDASTVPYDPINTTTSALAITVPYGFAGTPPEPFKIRANIYNMLPPILAETLRNARPVVVGEGWDSGLMSVLGSVARSIGPTVTPDVLFSLLWPSVRTMMDMGWPEMSTRNLWGKCCRIVAYVRSEEVQPEIVTLVSDDRDTLVKRAAEAMNCPPTYEAVKHKLIVKVKGGIVGFNEHTLTYGGYCDSAALGEIFREMCPTLAGPVATAEGFAEMSQREIEREYYTYAEDVYIQYGFKGKRFDSQTKELIEGTCPVDPALEPRFHPDIDRWLRALGGEWHEKLLDWISLVTHTSKQLPALYIRGPASIGKTLLAHGLAAIWRSAPVPFHLAFETYNGAVMDSPLFYVDEKLEESKRVTSGDFRTFIGSPSLTVNRKFLKRCPLIGAPRLLITANNDDALSFRELMSADDIGAVRLRIGYLRSPGTDASSPAQDVLNEVTAKGVDLDSWKFGPIAEHALWLRDNRNVEPGRRFLMDGFNTDFTEQLVTQNSISGDVTAAICKMIMTPHVRNRMSMCQVGGGEILINSNQLQAEWDALGDPGTDPPRSKILAKALKAISSGSERRIIAGHRTRVWVVRPEVVYASERQDENYDIEDLQAIVEKELP